MVTLYIFRVPKLMSDQAMYQNKKGKTECTSIVSFRHECL